MSLFSSIDKLTEQAWSLRNANTAQALELSEQALAEAQKAHYSQGLAASHITIGFCQFRYGNHQDAKHHSEEALKLYTSFEHVEGQQRALNNLGMIHGQSGNYAEALKNFLKLQKLCQSNQASKDKIPEANALNNIGIIYKLLGEHTEALEYNFQSLKLYELMQDQAGISRVLANVGAIYDDTGQHDEALKHYEKSLAKQNPDADPHTYALTFSNIGTCYRKLENYTRAFEYQYKSLDIMESIKDKVGKSFTFDELGLTSFAIGNSDEAIKFLKESLALKKEAGDRKHFATSSLYLGDIYLQAGNHEALNVFREALTIATDVKAKTEVFNAHYGLAKTYEILNDFESAFSHMHLYSNLRDDFFNEISNQRFHALRVSYEVEQAEKEKEIYKLKSIKLAQAYDELHTLKNELEKQANEDPLTGLYNRRVFNEKIEQEFSRATRFDGIMTVMICDIDNFKKVNDSFSHQVGDEVLKHVAKLFKENIRSVDTVARYGGEEFVLLLPETASQDAYPICDRLRAKIAGFPWHDIHPDLKVTLSMGLCDDLASKDAHEMISKADNILYKVKRNGKNHVRIWDNSHVLETVF